MKIKTYTQVVFVIVCFALGLNACRSSRVVYVERDPKVIVVEQPRSTAPAKKRIPIIITRNAESINQYKDGKFYIKREGIFYWKGFENRWYMDEMDLPKVLYTDAEYLEWTKKGKTNNGNAYGKERREREERERKEKRSARAEGKER